MRSYNIHTDGWVGLWYEGVCQNRVRTSTYILQYLWDVITYLSLWYLLLAPWWRHQMEIFSALLAICAGNSPVPGEFPTQRPVTRSFDVFFDRRLNKRWNKQSWGWWLGTLSCPLWRHRNDESPHISPCVGKCPRSVAITSEWRMTPTWTDAECKRDVTSLHNQWSYVSCTVHWLTWVASIHHQLMI